MNEAALLHEEPRRGLPNDCAPGPTWASVLLVDPAHFDVVYCINPHMRPGSAPVDSERARRGHEALRLAYESLGFPVRVLPAAPGLPDLVFCANQSFPFTDPAGRPRVLLSRMRHAARAPEVGRLRRVFEELGWPVEEAEAGEDDDSLEGCGDLLWFPGKRLLLGGFGFRTSYGRLVEVARRTRIDLVPLRLVDEGFYHLDTCLAPLDAGRALWVEEAFDPDSRARLRALFETLIPIPGDEARRCLAANAHCPDGRHVLIEKSAEATARRLAEAGLRVLPIDTAPFLLSGGSVFCLKQMLPRDLRDFGA